MIRSIRSLIVSMFCFILVSAVNSQAFICTTFLVQPKSRVHFNQIASIKDLIKAHTVSKQLTEAEKRLIEQKIVELQNISEAFTQSYNLFFENQDADFLVDLRSVFETEDASLRLNIQRLIIQLRRFLNDNKDLRFRDLDIFRRIKTLSETWGISYIDNPERVYFNLSFFVTSRLSTGEYKNGYVFSEDNSEELNKPLFVLKNSPLNLEGGKDQLYPGSQIPIPRISNELVFPGLPLDIDLLQFLTAHGNSKGRIQLAASYHYHTKNKILGQLWSSLQTQRRLPIFNSRWSTSRKSYFPIFNSDGTPNHDLSNLGNYMERNGHLMIPTLPVVWIRNPKGLFPKTEDQLRTGLEVNELEIADFAVAPTPFEFLIAFTELYKPNH